MELEDEKMYLVLYREEGEMERRVSHGVGDKTLRNYVVSNDPLSSFDYKKDSEGYYVLLKD